MRRNTICLQEEKDLQISSRSLTIEEWFDSKEAAAYLRITEGSLRNMVCQGKIQRKKLGSRNRYRVQDLRDLLTLPRKENHNGN